MNYTRRQLENTLSQWFDNMLNVPEAWVDDVKMVVCGPFDELYAKHGVSITTLVQDNTLHVAVGFEGSAETEWSGPFVENADFDPAAAKVIDVIFNIVGADRTSDDEPEPNTILI